MIWCNPVLKNGHGALEQACGFFRSTGAGEQSAEIVEGQSCIRTVLRLTVFP